MAAQLETSENNALISEINVTPFVDVVLVLLVIFMITAPALLKDTIGIHLPKATPSDTRPLNTLGIAVTRQGQILLNGQTASPESLKAEVAHSLGADPETQALISADSEARHGDVVRAIDLIQSAGLHRFALQIEHSQP